MEQKRRQACRNLCGFIAALILVSSRLETVHGKCSFPAIFNFGDSNSDTGGFYAVFPPLTPPYGISYFKKPAGRASDGRLVIDFLAQALGLPFLSPYLQSIGSNFIHGANYASDMGTVLKPNTSLFVSGISPLYLGVQLEEMQDFKSRVLDLLSRGITLGYLPSKSVFHQALYTLNIGQNDFSFPLANIGIEGVKKFLPQVASQIGDTIKSLHAVGARTIFVENLAPIGCFPSYLTLLPHNKSDVDKFGCMISYNQAVIEYNKMLYETLESVRKSIPDASVIYVDTHAIKWEISTNPTKHGFKHGVKACCGFGGGEHNFSSEIFCGQNKTINGVLRVASACPDPSNYVSWDGTHNTEAANLHIAKEILTGRYFKPFFNLSSLCDLQSVG